MAHRTGNILVVDDDRTILDSLKLLLKYEFNTITTLQNPNRIPEHLASLDIDVIVLDMNFKAGIQTGNEGIFWMKQILKFDPQAVVVLITAYGDIHLAVDAIKKGATDFIQKPWDSEKLISTIKTALQLRLSRKEVNQLQQKKKVLQEDLNKQFNTIIAESASMREVLSTIKKIAHTNTNVMILGENGTGKELVAREVHRLSRRAKDVFTTVDMASIAESLFEAELFGYVKGAFTDASQDRTGRFENASGGTLFLDEIGNLPMSMQSKILTVLQNREIVKLGSNKNVSIDVRLISATNKNLAGMIAEGLFREDLFYRINTVTLEIPPLRERGSDIVLLTEFFLEKFKKKYEKPMLKISSRSLDHLMNYPWPGNVRELDHTIEKAVILCESDVLKPENLFFKPVHTQQDDEKHSLKLVDVEKSTIRTALRKHNGVYASAARELGISRPTLYKKIKKYDL